MLLSAAVLILVITLSKTPEDQRLDKKSFKTHLKNFCEAFEKGTMPW